MVVPAIDMKQDVCSRLTMEVNIGGLQQWRFRVRLGLWLIGIAARLMWIEMETTEDEATNVIRALMEFYGNGIRCLARQHVLTLEEEGRAIDAEDRAWAYLKGDIDVPAIEGMALHAMEQVGDQGKVS